MKEKQYFFQKENLIKYFIVECTHREKICCKCGKILIPYAPHVRASYLENKRFKKHMVYCLECTKQYFTSLDSFTLP